MTLTLVDLKYAGQGIEDDVVILAAGIIFVSIVDIFVPPADLFRQD